MSTVRQGDVLAGKFSIEQVLGQGGMGVVVAARHLQLGHRVAIKFLLPEASQNVEAVGRFLREARAAVQIRSEHVARVTDVGTFDNGAPYMVMEFLQGSDLGQVLDTRGGPFSVDEAVGYVLQACEAIAEAHALGIIHRDLKPANLFLARHADGSPLVKVLDFGISKATHVDPFHQSDANLTKTSVMMGSPTYMSPEQLRSAKDVDSRTDIWSLGVILYEFLAGRPVYQADTMSGLLAQIVADPATPLRALRPDAPAALETIVMRCLEKDRTRRVSNVAELARALLPFAPKERASVERISKIVHGPDSAPVDTTYVPPSAPSSALPPVPGSTSGAWGTTDQEPPPRRSNGPRILISLAVLVVGVGAAAYMLRPTGERSDLTATATLIAPLPEVPAPKPPPAPDTDPAWPAPSSSRPTLPPPTTDSPAGDLATSPAATPSAGARPATRPAAVTPRPPVPQAPKPAKSKDRPTPKPSSRDLFDDTK